MGKIYFTSDLHIYHDREFIYKPRGFNNHIHMATEILANWFDTVKEDDDIYVLGDFFLGADFENIKILLKSLPGKIHLIRGNHDTDAKIAIYEEAGIDVKWADVIKHEGKFFYLSHYPTITSTLESDPSKSVINLHGHVHTNKKFYYDVPFMYNVSVDANENKIISIDEIIENIQCKVTECCWYLDE